jgi:hypothetical protein
MAVGSALEQRTYPQFDLRKRQSKLSLGWVKGGIIVYFIKFTLKCYHFIVAW